MRAPAKINLTLHVLGRRASDGYHELQSLVVFAGVGDHLTLTPEASSLAVEGPTADAAGAGPDNLVLRATRNLQERVTHLKVGAFRLQKFLPVAAGIGGGSSDAAAALRLLAHANGIALDDPRVIDAARATGADVPVCVEAKARMMSGGRRGIGAGARFRGHPCGPRQPRALLWRRARYCEARTEAWRFLWLRQASADRAGHEQRTADRRAEERPQRSRGPGRRHRKADRACARRARRRPWREARAHVGVGRDLLRPVFRPPSGGARRRGSSVATIRAGGCARPCCARLARPFERPSGTTFVACYNP